MRFGSGQKHQIEHQSMKKRVERYPIQNKIANSKILKYRKDYVAIYVYQINTLYTLNLHVICQLYLSKKYMKNPNAKKAKKSTIKYELTPDDILKKA